MTTSHRLLLRIGTSYASPAALLLLPPLTRGRTSPGSFPETLPAPTPAQDFHPISPFLLPDPPYLLAPTAWPFFSFLATLHQPRAVGWRGGPGGGFEPRLRPHPQWGFPGSRKSDRCRVPVSLVPPFSLPAPKQREGRLAQDRLRISLYLALVF